MNRTTMAAAFCLALLAALCLLAACGGDEAPRGGTENAGEAATAPGDVAGEPTYYACPMACIPPIPEAGDCPVCGMELVRLDPEDAPSPSPVIRLTPEESGVSGIRLAPVQQRFVTARIRMFGNIEYDPGYYTELDAFTSGVIDKVYVRRTGEFIRPDQKLFDFYSAEIFDMELELLDLARRIPTYIEGQLGGSVHPSLRGWPGRQGETQAPAYPGAIAPEQFLPEKSDTKEIKRQVDLQRKFATLRFRLRSYGLYDKDINEILRLERPVGIITVRVPTLTSTAGGVLIANDTYQGRYVNTGTPLMTIADPHFIWANLRAFEADYAWLRFGQDVEFEAVARPGELFKGRITQIDPIFDPETRTFYVGVVYDDAKRKLRPNMLVRAEVLARLDNRGLPATEKTPDSRAPLVIPASAPLLTGTRAVVYVAVPGEPGAFEAREVVLGPKAEDSYVVLDGLEKGEMVVVNGNFRLDSELQIQARPSMMNPENLVRKQTAHPAASGPDGAMPDHSMPMDNMGHDGGAQ